MKTGITLTRIVEEKMKKFKSLAACLEYAAENNLPFVCAHDPKGNLKLVLRNAGYQKESIK
jgi:hypothetical protein